MCVTRHPHRPEPGAKFRRGYGARGRYLLVHLDGKAVRSCVLPVSAVGARAITTIEGVGTTPVGAKVQKAWLDLEVVQCGYCQSGQIMSASALLAATRNRVTRISVRPCQAISAAAALMFGFATPSSARRGRDHEPGTRPYETQRAAPCSRLVRLRAVHCWVGSMFLFATR